MTRSSTAPASDADASATVTALSSVSAHRTGARDQAMAMWLAERRITLAGATLDDVVGLHAAKREVQSLIARLRHPEVIREAGGELPRSILFYGPAGTGKTTLARVLASALAEGERAVPFYELSGGDLTATRLFALRDHSAARPSSAGIAVIFVDEVDAIAMQRNHYAHTPESRRALYALLAVLDGLRATPNVLWLFTSNTPPAELDRAITRSGRMGWHIETTYPTAAEREALFRHFARGRRFVGAFDWVKAAEMMGSRTSGAEVRQVLDDALALTLADAEAMSADGASGDPATRDMPRPAAADWAHLIEAIQRRGYVSDRRQPLDDRERRIAAAHESGHALVAALLGLPVGQIALDQTTGGAFTDLGEEDKPRPTGKSDATVLDLIAVGLAGYVAERLLLDPNEVSLGAADDLQRATNLALARIDAGNDPGFPFVSRGAFDPQQPPSLRNMAAAAAAATLTEQRGRVERLLAEHQPELRALAQRIAIAENGQLGGEELRHAFLEIGLAAPSVTLEGEA